MKFFNKIAVILGMYAAMSFNFTVALASNGETPFKNYNKIENIDNKEGSNPVVRNNQEILKFAFITDMHYSRGSETVSALEICVDDVNRRKDIEFVIFGGDLTEFGTDYEIGEVKKTVDKLKCPYYIVAGNHDATWSESGCNTFKEVFGYEHFEFEKAGWRFIGCNSGPDMRMSPALVSKENMLWLKQLPRNEKTIFINHYPQDTSVLNYFDVTRILKKLDTRFEIGGHYHKNIALNYDGIPGVLGRASYTPESAAGYNLFELEGDNITISEIRVCGQSSVRLQPWYENDLKPVVDTVNYNEHGLPDSYPWMRYDVNEKYSDIKKDWTFSESSNIATGFAKKGKRIYYATTSGVVKARSIDDGSLLWSKTLPGKIYSTPDVYKKYLVIGCADGYVYALNAKNGEELWKYRAQKSVLGSPVIYNKNVYIGSSDGCFRSLDLYTGKANWTFSNVRGFIECKPYVDKEQIIFGSWGNELYSLELEGGHLQWKWRTDGCRMFSPAVCTPVKSRGKLFIPLPNRNLYMLEARTGKIIDVYKDKIARESVGLSQDGNTVYSKSMFNRLVAISSITGEVKWNVETGAGYDLSPTSCVEVNGIVLMPTDKGNILAFNAKDGAFLWAHKISTALVNPMKVWTEKYAIKVLASTMDGVVELFTIPVDEPIKKKCNWKELFNKYLYLDSFDLHN